MKLKDIPVPPSARQGELEGAYEVKLRTSASEVLRELKEKYGTAEVEIYFLVPDAEWSAIRNFYESEFQPVGLARDSSFAEEHTGYRLAVWSHDGWLDKKAVAIAVIEAGAASEGKSQKFLAVFKAGD